jgi:hypothetical protein
VGRRIFVCWAKYRWACMDLWKALLKNQRIILTHNRGYQQIKEPVKEPTLTFASLTEKPPI